VIYIFHGDDSFGVGQSVRELRERMAAESDSADLNTTVLDGRRLSIGELEAAASAAPFLGDRRLVIVDNLLARCNPRGDEPAGKDFVSSCLAYLPRVPDTTRLVFADAKLHANNAVLKWALKAAQGDPDVIVRAFDAPKTAALPAWLRQRAQARGGAIDPAAATALAEALNQEGTVNLRLADSELEKLLTYANDRAVAIEDVRELVAPIGLDSIFELMEAMADRNGPRATGLLHRYLESGEPPLRIMALVARQVRLLTITRGLVDAGAGPQEFAARLPVPGFVVPKLQRQARRFSLHTLTDAVAGLAALDEAIKTGQIEAGLALDVFVCALCAGQRPYAPPPLRVP
jgi:DNA polymerase-3 subunit delta